MKIPTRTSNKSFASVVESDLLKIATDLLMKGETSDRREEELRKVLAVLVPAVLILALLAAVPAQGMVAKRGGPYYAWSNGHLYAHWECDLVGGGIVAAGLTMGGGAVVWAIGSTLAGASFTAGCQLGAPANPYYMYGVPYDSNPLIHCWMVYPHGSWSHRFKRCMYTV